MVTTLELGEVSVDVVSKDIKNVHLSVHPPTGRVRISAPQRMEIEAIRLYAISKLGWIKEHQQKLQEQERETPREYLERESHYVWGKRYLLSIVEQNTRPTVEREHQRLVLTVRPDANEASRHTILEDWYREQVRIATAELINAWEDKIEVEVTKVYIQCMKTRWGSCNSQAKTIRLNTDLGRKSPECLEYIVVHEMIHILEPTHNERFQSYMSHFMPDWKHRRQVLNQLPLRHANWTY
ncbi:MAG: SprT family zinc-dependent metalloprotease [Planctomycetota bacterium]